MRSPWWSCGGLAVVYALAAGVSWGLQPLGSVGSSAEAVQSATVWLGSAVLFTAFLRGPHHLALWLTAWGVATLWGVMGHHLDVTGGLAFGLIEVLAAALGAMVANRPGVAAQSLSAQMRLLAGAGLTAAIGASLGTAWWAWNGHGVWQAEWRTWALSTLTGILLLVPVAQAFTGFQARRSGGMSQRQLVAGGVAFGAFVVLAWLVFEPDVQRTGTVLPTLAYLPMPLLLAAAMLWGARGGSLAWLVGGSLVVVCSAYGGGPFAMADTFAGEAVVEAQAFVAIWSVLLLFGRGVANDRLLALQSAHQWRLRYERAMAAAHMATVEWDAVTGAATWSPGAAQVLGADLATLSHVPAWMAQVDAADAPLAQAAWQQACAGQTPPPQTLAMRFGGQPRTVQMALAPVAGADGAVELVSAWLQVRTESAGQP